MKIKNIAALATTPLRKDALLIAEAGFAAIDTDRIVRQAVRLEADTLVLGDVSIARKDIGRIIVVGIGKCVTEGAAALESILGDHIEAGVVIDVKKGPVFKHIQSFEGTHPLPTEANVAATKTLVETLRGLTEHDLVIFLISGGGSTLLCLPDDRNCEEEARIVHALTKAGATIQELNTIRKHLSFARGGFLASYAYPARVVSLIFSDVTGDDIQFVASGPTVRDTTTTEDAERIVQKYDVLNVCRLDRCGFIETPKAEKYFERVTNHVVVSNATALHAMQEKAIALGYQTRIVTTALTGEAREVGDLISRAIHEAPGKTALLYGGETEVTVRTPGKGGRNLELALSALRSASVDTLVLSIASDGRDNTDFAGGIADQETRTHGAAHHIDPEEFLETNRSYAFFEATGDYLDTGHTGSNVSDLIIALRV